MKSINNKAPVICSRSIIINSQIEKVWTILSDINNWSAWQKDISYARIEDELKPGSRFDWKSGGVVIHSILHTVEPRKYLGWTGKSYGINAIHNWTLATNQSNTEVSVEESMDGLIARVFRKSLQKSLSTGMQHWLDLLKEKCES